MRKCEIPGLETWLYDNKGNFSLDLVLKIVSKALRVNVEMFKSGNGKPEWLTLSRQIACYFARTLTNASLKEIGEAVGVHHSNVVVSRRNIENGIYIGDQKITDKVNTVFKALFFYDQSKF